MAHDSSYLLKPGLHSHNLAQRVEESPPSRNSGVSKVQVFLLLVGLACFGYYAYTLADQKIYQVYENWAFDQQIAGRPPVTFRDYIREETPFGFLTGKAEAVQLEPTPPVIAQPMPADGSVIGRVAIGRLNLSAVVRQGVDDNTLREAVGHLPSTALPGQAGNFAIAAHRDTLFRALKDIKQGDLVTFQSPMSLFTYQVVATRIVQPTDVSVLRPDGGGLIGNPGKLLTMITCYPFYYVGSAPKRFIVEAQLVTDTQYGNPNQRK
jgi:sortase A